MQPRSEPASSNNPAQPNSSDQQQTPPSQQQEQSKQKKRQRHEIIYGKDSKRARTTTTPSAMQSIPTLLTSPPKTTSSHTSTTPSSTSPQQNAETSPSSAAQSSDQRLRIEYGLTLRKLQKIENQMEEQGKLIELLQRQVAEQAALMKELIRLLSPQLNSAPQTPQSTHFQQSSFNAPVPPTSTVPTQFNNQAASSPIPLIVFPPPMNTGQFFHHAPQMPLPNPQPPFGLNYVPNFRSW